MDRREFLHGVGVALAAALTPGLAGCPTAGGPRLESLSEADPAQVARQLRERARAIRATGVGSTLSAFTRSRGADPDLSTEMAVAIWTTSTFRDLPPRLQREVEIQQWLRDEGPAIAAAVFGMAELLEGLDPSERLLLAEVIRADDGLADALAQGFAGRGEVAGVEPERLDQAAMLAGHVAWRLRRQSVSAVVDDYLDRVDRVCRRHGMERREWRERLASERVTWPALTVVADPSGVAVAQAAEGLPAEVLESLHGGGAHLGLVVEGRERQRGLRVHSVAPEGPAARAGVRPGDLLVAIDGHDVGPVELIAWLSARSPQDPVTLDLLRAGQPLQVRSSLLPGPGDRILSSRSRKGSHADEHPTVRVGYAILGVGSWIGGGGLALFVLGLLLMAAGGGGLEGGLTSLGMGLTIVGATLALVGLAICAIGATVILIGEAQKDADRRAGRPWPPDEWKEEAGDTGS